MAERFENLKVWQLSHSLALKIYSITSEFPSDEKFGLTSQLRRSATSVAANIVEGCCRQGNSEFKRFVHIARGSCGETIYHLVLARDLSFLNEDNYTSMRAGYEEVSRMLNGLVSSLNKR